MRHQLALTITYGIGPFLIGMSLGMNLRRRQFERILSDTFGGQWEEAKRRAKRRKEAQR